MRERLWVVVLLGLSSGVAFGQGADFYTVTPCRLYDSRDEDGPFTPGEQRELQVATECGVPYNAVAVTANLTAVDATSTGSFIVFPDSTEPTTTNTVSYRPGINVAVGGIHPLATSGLGTLSVLADLPEGQADLAFDVTGYFVKPPGGPSPSTVPICKTTGTVPAADCWEGKVQLSGSLPTSGSDQKAFYAKLYREARIKITFTRSSPARTYSTYAYWDGELSFVFRTVFPYPDQTWTWSALCESGCQGRTVVQPAEASRKVTVTGRRSSPLIYSRGLLKTHSSGRYLVHQDGTKFFWLGDTAWAAPMRTVSVSNSVSTWTTYLTDRAAPPGGYTPAPSAPTAGKYSIVQVSLAFHAGAGGYTACTNGLECLKDAKNKAFTTPKKKATIPGAYSYWNPEYWRNLDRLVYQANEKGVVVVLTGVMDPFGGGKNELANDAELQILARNLVARMAGFFVIYSVGWDNRVEEAAYKCGSDSNASSVVSGFNLLPSIVTRMNAVGSTLREETHRQLIPQLVTTHLGGGTPFLGGDSYFHDPGSDGANTPLASAYSTFHRQSWLDFHLFQSGQCNPDRPSVFLNQGTGTAGSPCQNFVQEAQLACVMRRARTMPAKFLSLKSDDTPLGSAALVKPAVNGEARYERTVLSGNPPVADIAYQSRHAGHVTTLSGAFGFTGGVYNVGEWRWPGDGMGITGAKAGKSPGQLKYLSVLQEGYVMEWERLRRKEAMLLNAGTDENERSVVAVSENNKTIVAYLPERPEEAQPSLKLAINPDIYKNFDTCQWLKKWWNPVNGLTSTATAQKQSSSSFQFTPPACARGGDKCDWVLLLSDLGACPTASGQTQVWSGLDDSTGEWGVFAQQWLPTGQPAGPIVPISDLSASVQTVPQIGRDTGQQALVAWVAEDSDGEGYGIVARKLDELGLPTGDIIRISDSSQGDQVSPSVAAMEQSGYVVTWTAYSEGNDQGEVYARYLDLDGNPLASPFQVNVTATGEQGHSMVASDPRGNVVIAWESWGQDGDGNGIFARRFDPSRTGSEEFQVYRAGAGWQYLAGLSARPAGGFEVRWQVYTPHGHDLGIWGQRLKATGPPREGDEFSVAGPQGE